MRCEDIRDELMDVTAPDLSSADPRVREHLTSCERCRDELWRTSGVWSLLSSVPDEEPDSLAMRQQFAGLVKAFREAGPHGTRWRGRAWLAWQPLHVVAMLVALLVGGLAGWQLALRERTAEPALDAMRQELREVREMLTLSLLQQRVASDRLRGVSAVERFEDPRADVLTALVDALLHDPNVNVRLACIRVLARFRDRPLIRQGVADALVLEQSPLVTIALISFIVDAQDATAIDVLQQLSQDPAREPAVRDTAAQGVERLKAGGRI